MVRRNCLSIVRPTPASAVFYPTAAPRRYICTKRYVIDIINYNVSGKCGITLTYYCASGVHPTLTMYSSHGNRMCSGYCSSNISMSTICSVSVNRNCTIFRLLLALDVPALGNLNSSISSGFDVEGKQNIFTSLSSTSSYTIL